MNAETNKKPSNSDEKKGEVVRAPYFPASASECLAYAAEWWCGELVTPSVRPEGYPRPGGDDVDAVTNWQVERWTVCDRIVSPKLPEIARLAGVGGYVGSDWQVREAKQGLLAAKERLSCARVKGARRAAVLLVAQVRERRAEIARLEKTAAQRQVAAWLRAVYASGRENPGPSDRVRVVNAALAVVARELRRIKTECA